MSTLILTIGDSKTAWNQTPNFLTFSQAWPGQMQTTLQAVPKSVTVINPAISGSSAGTDGHSPWLSPTTGTSTAGWFAGVEVNDSALYTGYLAIVALTHNDIVFGSSASFIENRLQAIGAVLAVRHYRVMLTTALPSGVVTGSLEVTRQAVNAWILGGTHGYFVSDFNTIPETQLINDTTWYSDTTHPTAALAAKMGPKVATDVVAQGLA